MEHFQVHIQGSSPGIPFPFMAEHKTYLYGVPGCIRSLLIKVAEISFSCWNQVFLEDTGTAQKLAWWRFHDTFHLCTSLFAHWWSAKTFPATVKGKAAVMVSFAGFQTQIFLLSALRVSVVHDSAWGLVFSQAFRVPGLPQVCFPGDVTCMMQPPCCFLRVSEFICIVTLVWCTVRLLLNSINPHFLWPL